MSYSFFHVKVAFEHALANINCNLQQGIIQLLLLLTIWTYIDSVALCMAHCGHTFAVTDFTFAVKDSSFAQFEGF
jgi:hypothetical protein